MDDRLKFRSWDEDNQKYNYIKKYLEMNSGNIVSAYTDFWGMVLMHDWTIEQCTDLKDKNGTLIYDGDIVEWDDSFEKDRSRVRTAKTCINPDIYFEILPISKSSEPGHKFHYGNFIYKDTEKHLEIIGNIHENPELLEGEVKNG